MLRLRLRAVVASTLLGATAAIHAAYAPSIVTTACRSSGRAGVIG
jgi:hypothetical protein